MILAVVVGYGFLVLPWMLALFFALLWWRQRSVTAAFREGYLEKVIQPPRKRGRARR